MSEKPRDKHLQDEKRHERELDDDAKQAAREHAKPRPVARPDDAPEKEKNEEKAAARHSRGLHFVPNNFRGNIPSGFSFWRIVHE